MDAYPMLIYGGGNCEISGRLQQEMHHICRLDLKQQKVYARTYLLANSCLAMYKRFQELKDKVEHTTIEGIYEYIYNGEGEGIERQELKMSSSSSQVAFKRFLEEALERLDAREVQLICSGQSFKGGLFLDIYDTPPSYLPYEAFFRILYDVASMRDVSIHLILDIPMWHPIEVPYRAGQNPYVKSLAIWKREGQQEVFPIAKWISAWDQQDEDTLKEIRSQWIGIDLKGDELKVCKEKWEMYKSIPSATTWSLCRNACHSLIGDKSRTAIWGNDKDALFQIEDDEQKTNLDDKDLREYFKLLYNEALDLEAIELWINEVKNCISYYKM